MMNLNLTWTAPSPRPTCGFKAEYRRKADGTISEVDTSGTTATIVVNAPACYEGVIVADCCSGTTATGAPFGVNAYSTFSIERRLNGLNQVVVTVISTYSNPYGLKINGTYIITTGGQPQSHNFSIDYPAGSTLYTQTLTPQYPGGTLTSLTITSYTPIFDTGTSLQVLDPVSTPSYFKFYLSGQPAPVWNGSPLSLPSFTVDAFNATEVDVDGVTVLAGNLLISYILSEYFTTSFTSLELEVYDGITLLGSVIVSTGPLGARNAVIPIVKGTNPLNNTSVFAMVAVWPDTTFIDRGTFTLPLP
jgi:hypothetical protein